ncbi:hypothetical protein, partial [Candidatus Entotheonella palauensis]|uniref:hypothetical protein n=1 Tax=Candidatus Entotheonella palauensis TaxID=93172 RepID=UPI0011779723
MASFDPHGHHDWHSQQYVEEWITSATARDPERRAILRRVAGLIPREADAGAFPSFRSGFEQSQVR